MRWFTFICLSVIFLVTPFQWGLYYDSDIRFWEWFIFGLFLMNVAWFWLKEPEILLKNKVYFLVFLLPFMYVLTVPFALNPEGNWNTIFRFFTYSFFFLLLMWTKEEVVIKNLYSYIFHILGVSFLVFSLANKLDFIYFNEYMVGCEPGRACGPVRYPNTFAAIMGAYWFYTFAILIRRRSFDWITGFLLLLIAGYGAVLLHTYSRGAYIFFACAFILAITLLYKQWKKLLLYSSSFIFLSIGVFSFASIEQNGRIQVIPDSLKARISDISPSTDTAAARISFYEEAISMSNDSPWFGFGGDSWPVYYPKYEDKKFGLDQVHNGYLDFLIEIGWIGILVFSLFFILLIYLILKSRSTVSNQTHRVGVILALSMLFGHGVVDYDFSYGTVWFLIYWLFAIGLNEINVEEIIFKIKLKPKTTKMVIKTMK
ncbi:O-antigen ligase family protein [Neobacillus sp. DY30]|uniref:O-antigen ligase family protein n=1 Tax=Neobacillus sp. DY30 TaxID=3047871 RepID=UPI0024C0BD5F|nr:O-antigen ligase family protein [Neobacillus sp. DY30]WHY00332.1 O-antigen ligase family protein [Neobacillus sp. DY30]